MPEILSIGELLDLGNSANMSAYIPYSGLEYNPSGAISGISGSALAGGVESSVVSSIVSSMVSSKADQSAVDECCSAMSAVVSAKLDATASSMFQPSGNYQPSGDYYSATNPSGFITTADLTDYAKESALSSKLDASASSNFASSGDYVFESSYSSFTSEVTNNITSISSTVSGLTGDYLEKSASSMFQPSGEYAYESSLSSYLPSSASSNFAPSADYAYNSALSSKLEASASSDFYSTSNPSGFITGVDLSEYQEKSGMSAYQLSGDYAYNSALSSKMDASASSEFLPASASGDLFTGVETDSTLTGNGLHSSVLGVNTINIAFTAPLSTSEVANAIVVSIDSANYLAPSSLSAGPSGTVSSVNNSAFFDPRIQIVSASTLATGANIVYIVTGNA